ncbi:hypothetical protein PRIPAC_83674, partial [Pristionchus pacificus]|uniref:Uncharacterized protein n=1 Tax=Pristionchus pacificus TaxID=54126 RepID=A0A2A6BUG7_PRIPA
MRLLLFVICFFAIVVLGKIFTPECAPPLEHKAAISGDNRLSCSRGFVMAVDNVNVETFTFDSIECSSASTFTYKVGNVEKTAAK